MTKKMEVTVRGNSPYDPGLRTVLISPNCPTCSDPRGEIKGYNGCVNDQYYNVNVWQNPCGHQDTYEAVLQEGHIRRVQIYPVEQQHVRDLATDYHIRTVLEDDRFVVVQHSQGRSVIGQTAKLYKPRAMLRKIAGFLTDNMVMDDEAQFAPGPYATVHKVSQPFPSTGMSSSIYVISIDCDKQELSVGFGGNRVGVDGDMPDAVHDEAPVGCMVLPFACLVTVSAEDPLALVQIAEALSEYDLPH